MLSKVNKKNILELFKICMQSHFAHLSIFTFLVIFIDQYSKYLMLTYHSDAVLKNYGLSFGLISGTEIWGINLVSFISVIVLGLFIYLFYKQSLLIRKHRSLFTYASIFVVSGGLGNIIDRFYRGYVVDFITFPSWWLSYNIADMAISIGVILILIILFLDEKGKIEPNN